jgi:hypothetical protein
MSRTYRACMRAVYDHRRPCCTCLTNRACRHGGRSTNRHKATGTKAGGHRHFAHRQGPEQLGGAFQGQVAYPAGKGGWRFQLSGAFPAKIAQPQ